MTTNEMSRSVGDAASGSSSIADNVKSVAAGSTQVHEGSRAAADAAAELAQHAAQLQSLIGRFSYA